MKKTHQVIAARVSAILLLLASGSIAQADMAPRRVADQTFEGIRHIHGARATPRMYFGVRPTWGRGHHGTPRQRMNAVVRGMEAASQAGLKGVRACFS